MHSGMNGVALLPSGMNADGSCPDCGHTPTVGEWPYPCAGKDHILYMRLAIMPSGRTKEYAPPSPINPIKDPVITRDWMNADGTLRPMHKDEWDKRNVTYVEPGVKI